MWLLFLLSGIAHSVDMQKVETLFIQKKRVEAARAANADKALLSQILEGHYTNRALQLYEEASASFFVDPAVSAQKLTELEKKEPFNVKVLSLKARLMFRKDDCRGAEKVILSLRDSYGDISQLRSLGILLASCRGEPMSSDVMSHALNSKDWSLLAALAGYAGKRRVKPLMRNLVDRFLTRVPEFPEIWFFKAYLAEGKAERDENRAVYTSKCRTLADLEKRFAFNPWTCLNQNAQYDRDQEQ